MKKIVLLTTITAAIACAGFRTGAYENEPLEYISFTDSVAVSSEIVASREGGTGTGANVPIVYTGFNIDYRYDELDRTVTLLGRGMDQVYTFDAEMRPVAYVDGNSLTTATWEYLDDRVVVEEYPNEPLVSQTSTRWTYLFENGDTSKIIIATTDKGEDGEYEWFPEYSDTISISYNEDGTRSGVKRTLWSIVFTVQKEWQRVEDTLSYSYDTLNAGTDEESVVTTITQMSQVNDGWEPQKGDTQYVEIRDVSGRLIKETERRWDHYNDMWDAVYYEKTEYVYSDSLLSEMNITQYYGTINAPDSITGGGRAWSYKSNSIVSAPSNETAIEARAKTSTNDRAVVRLSGKELRLVNGTADRIALYDLSGRLIQSVVNKSVISLEGIGAVQPLVCIAYVDGKPLLKKRLILR